MPVDVRRHVALTALVAAVGVAVAKFELALEIGALTVDNDARFTVRIVAGHSNA